MRFPVLLLALLAIPLRTLSADPLLPIDDFSSGTGWGAVGSAQVETADQGYRGRCLKMTLGAADSGPVHTAIVQGPNSAASDAWERAPTGGLNAIVFYARASKPTVISVVLRVRSRTVAGLPGVQGVLQTPVAIAGSDWRHYAVRLNDFQGPPALMPAGDALFREWWPQIQFQMAPLPDPSAPPRIVWVDELAFGAAEKSSGSELPMVYPGLDRTADLSSRFDPAKATRIELPDHGRSVKEMRTW
jgi:hypothetical protein